MVTLIWLLSFGWQPKYWMLKRGKHVARNICYGHLFPWCFPVFPHWKHWISRNKVCFCLMAETYFAAGNTFSHVAIPGIVGKRVHSKWFWQHVSNMFPRFVRPLNWNLVFASALPGKSTVRFFDHFGVFCLHFPSHLAYFIEFFWALKFGFLITYSFCSHFTHERKKSYCYLQRMLFVNQDDL